MVPGECAEVDLVREKNNHFSSKKRTGSPGFVLSRSPPEIIAGGRADPRVVNPWRVKHKVNTGTNEFNTNHFLYPIKKFCTLKICFKIKISNCFFQAKKLFFGVINSPSGILKNTKFVNRDISFHFIIMYWIQNGQRHTYEHKINTRPNEFWTNHFLFHFHKIIQILSVLQKSKFKIVVLTKKIFWFIKSASWNFKNKTCVNRHNAFQFTIMCWS